MSRINRVTTKQGDGGMTQLANGTAVAKVDPIIRALGSTDELNSHLGLLRHHHDDEPLLARIQQVLFDIGAVLATAGDHAPEGLNSATKALTDTVARLNAQLPALKEFVLPGGTLAAAQCHLCRAVCRRAEIDFWSVMASKDFSDHAQVNLLASAAYLNRLSDFFFVLARQLNDLGTEEQWHGPKATDA